MEKESKWKILTEWSEGYRHYVSAECEVCGEFVDKVRRENILGKNIRLCGCTRKPRGKPLVEGDVFGQLTVVERAYYNGKNVFYKVSCSCGIEKVVQASQLLNGSTTSCGCFLTEKRGAPREKHGKTGTHEYNVWASVVNRTSHPNKSTREWYYDKGIEVSAEWRASFTQFFEDMGPCPDGYTLDRIDPSGNYCKENCRWASVELQSINKGIFKNNTSGTTGVSQNKSGKYVAYIYWKWERIHLGTFSTIEEAINARKQAEEKYWSEVSE